MAKQFVTSSDVHGNKYQTPISVLKWRPSAYGIVINDGKILLSPKFGDNKYDLPGGGVELGETPEEAVIREVREETGLIVDKPELVDITTRFYTYKHDGKRGTNESLMIYYACNLVGGKLSTDGFDEREKTYAHLAEWVPMTRLDGIEIASTCDWRTYVNKAMK